MLNGDKHYNLTRDESDEYNELLDALDVGIQLSDTGWKRLAELTTRIHGAPHIA